MSPLTPPLTVLPWVLFTPVPSLFLLCWNNPGTTLPQNVCICCSHHLKSPLPGIHVTTPSVASGLFANVTSMEPSLTTLGKFKSQLSSPHSILFHCTYCLLSFLSCSLCYQNVSSMPAEALSLTFPVLYPDQCWINKYMWKNKRKERKKEETDSKSSSAF